MPDTYPVERRTVTGRAAKKLRREGVLPANIYGRGLESVAVQLPYAEARDMLNAHGRNVLVEVQVGDESKARPVVVRDIALHPVTGHILHVDFFQVDLARAIQADVPVVLVDEAPAVNTWDGILVQALESIYVEALPSDLPEQIEVSVAPLEELDQQIVVGDLDLGDKITVLTSEDLAVARIARPRIAAEAEEVVPEGEEPAEAAAETAEEAEEEAESEPEEATED